jgi:parallel beta-helix repeat protein
VTIRNGTIQGAGGTAIELHGGGFLVEQMHVRSSAVSGIILRADGGSGSSIARNNTVERNNTGIWVDFGLVEGNIVQGNTNFGIYMTESGRILNNVIRGNLSYGLFLNESVSYTGNVLVNNPAPQVLGGVNMGQNLCGNAACPNPVN